MAKTTMTRSTRGDDSTSATSNQSNVSQCITTFPSGDNNSLHITAHKFNGKNYLQWSQSVKIVICGGEKFEYVTGEAKAPATTY